MRLARNGGTVARVNTSIRNDSSESRIRRKKASTGKNKKHFELVVFTNSKKPLTEILLTASHKVLTISGTTAHMTNDVLVTIGKIVASVISIENAGQVTIKASAQQTK